MRVRLIDMTYEKGNYDLGCFERISVVFKHKKVEDNVFKVFLEIRAHVKDDIKFKIKMILMADSVLDEEHFYIDFIEKTVDELSCLLSALDCFSFMDKREC